MPNNTITYYEYDSNGRLLRARLKENTTSGSVLLNTQNKFDNLGRAVKSVYDLPKLGEKMTYTVSYKGNADVKSGRIASFGLPNGKSISYGYDKFDRLTSKSMGLTASSGIAEYYSYWTNGNITANLVTGHNLTIPGISVTYSYTYDNYGNILTVKEGSTLKLSYVYDELNQLTRENNAYANKTYVYTYDKNGNILTKKTYAYTTGTLGSVQNTVNYTYGNSSWKDLLTNYNGTSISYDGVGNPTNWRGNLNTLTWTGRELTGITMPSSQTMSYKYNADGIRTQKTFADNAVKYLYRHDYILDGANIVAETINYVTYTGINTTEVLYYYYDESGSPTGIKYNGNVYYFQKNLQGDIIRILNTQGSIVATYTYDAWGNIIASTDTSGVSIGTKNPFRYRGYYYDTETGLYYLNSRYYDPQVGRFLNADNVIAGINSDVKGYNMFAYCFNNPVNMTDSSGHWAEWLEKTVKVASVVVAIAAVVVMVTTVSAVSAGTAAPGALYASSIFLGAALSGINGGVANEAEGDSYINGYVGGAVGGTIQGALSKSNLGTIIGGGGGVALGTAVTDIMDNWDPYSSDSSCHEIVSNAIASGGKALITSSVTAFMGAAADLAKANNANGLFPTYSLGFAESIKSFFGWLDDALVYIWE